MENKNRAEAFKKNNEVENILDLLDKYLSPVEDKLTYKISSSTYPTIFIFGCARSGTTVLHQYLIQNTVSIYPSNFISRFYYAPYLGGLYHKLFIDLDKKGELLGDVKGMNNFFSSNLGKTEGVLSPNEFWYFWRKHFPINAKNTIDKNNIKEADANRFRNSIFGLQNLFEAPFITKGMIANNCIDYLERLFPKVIFIFIKRDLFANAKSLYKARLDFFGDPNKWYSFYPKDSEHYQNFSPEEQVIYQVLDTNKEIEKSLNDCDYRRVIEIDYASFCEDPKQILNRLKEVDDTIQFKTRPKPSNFSTRGQKSLENEAHKKIKKLIETIH